MNESAPSNSEFIALQQQVAGRYSLDRELGRGGMGIVLLARDVALDRPVAIKLLSPKLAVDADLRERFLREARTAAGLSHPNIVPIHAVEEHGDIVFFVMGYVDGETLRQRVERAGSITSGEAVRLIQEVAWALAHAHAKNVVHRDVKPDNILIDKATGRAMVTDFGIARVMDATGLTSAGEVVGTANYMSPEQASGDAVDARSDLYSLGVTAFYALTGKLPFDAETTLAVLAMHVDEPAPPVASVRADIPAKLAGAVDRCLMKDPAARFQSGEELAETAGAFGLVAKEIPPQIRLFLRSAWTSGALFAGMLVLFGWVVLTGSILVADGAITRPLLEELVLIAMGTLVFFFVPFICYPVVSAARKLLKDGMNFDDVRSALVIDARARSEETEVFRQAFVGLLRKFRRPDWSPILNLRKESGPNGDPKPAPLGHRFLAGPAGRLFFRIARVGLKTVPQTTSPAGDRTEVVLASAADSVFAALPREHRGRLADVPKIIRRLQVDAEALREREADLAKFMADVGGEGIERGRTRLQVLRADPDKQSEADLLTRRLSMIEDVEAERSRVSNRLGTVVAALENVRINLLRLRAGLGSIEEITADLEAARRICDDLDHEIEARTEVDQITQAAHG